ncbi:MAG TPA: hypothetical protein VKK31_06045 [Thermoanaerobaculia bacterium]|nr:hypothetical protein [Thermoanaerobaculia bacterium]
MAGLPSLSPALPVAILAWRIRALLRRFETLHAVSPDSAVSLDELNVRNSVIFRRFVKRGVIGKVGEDRYYLDRDRQQEWMKVRRKRAVVVVTVIGVIVFFLWRTGALGF